MTVRIESRIAIGASVGEAWAYFSDVARWPELGANCSPMSRSRRDLRCSQARWWSSGRKGYWASLTVGARK